MIVYNVKAVEATLINIVGDLIQDWGVDPEDGITGQTLLVADLDFTSVDIIQLCVAIEQHYRKKMGFQSLLMKDGSYVSDLSISQFVDFLVDRIETKEQ